MITNKELPALIKRAHDNATAHGFHDKPKSAAHWLMLIITEISEMVDADRKGKHADRVKFEANNKSGSVINKDIVFQVSFERYIKDSVEDELADICIRIFDFAELLRKYVGELEHYEKSHEGEGSDGGALFKPHVPKWAVDLFKERYNIKLIN